jgi:hypothetical protein
VQESPGRPRWNAHAAGTRRAEIPGSGVSERGCGDFSAAGGGCFSRVRSRSRSQGVT